MARYEVTYECGCTGTVNLFGKHADRERKLEWLAGQDCYACSSKKALEKAQADTTPVTMVLQPYTTSAGMDIVAVMQGGTYRVRDELKRLGAVWGVPPTSIDYATYGGNGLGKKCWYIRAPLNPKKVCELCEAIEDERVTAENVWQKLVEMAGILGKYPVDVKGSQRYIERMAGALGELRDSYLADKKDKARWQSRRATPEPERNGIMTNTININDINNAEIRGLLDTEDVDCIELVARGETEHGNPNSRVTIYRLDYCDGGSQMVCETNGDAIWDEADITEIAEQIGVEL